MLSIVGSIGGVAMWTAKSLGDHRLTPQNPVLVYSGTPENKQTEHKDNKKSVKEIYP